MTRAAERERERILSEYDRRRREIGDDLYALHRPANLFLRQGQERALLRGLHAAGLAPLVGRSVLEIGCGEGRWLSFFENFGAAPTDVAGIDLDASRVDLCRRRHPEADIRLGDATELPWPDARFDVVFQSTVFTSILDVDVRRAVAAEMMRVLAPGGVILWYDFHFDNPRNRNVRGVRRKELAALFPGWRIDVERVTLAPPLARRIAGHAWWLASTLERLTLLNTHTFAVIRRSR